MDWMIWAILLQQQAQQAAALRAQQEAEAAAKAQADAEAAKAAELQKQQQAAAQRQTEAAAAQQNAAKEADAKAAALAKMSPVAPADAYSPVGGSFWGSQTARDSSQNVGSTQSSQPLAQASAAPAMQSAFQNFGGAGGKSSSLPSPSSLGRMFGQAAQAGGDMPGSQGSVRNIGGVSGNSGAGFRLF